MVKSCEWSDTSTYLIPTEKMVAYYSTLCEDFPICHMMFSIKVSSHSYKVLTSLVATSIETTISNESTTEPLEDVESVEGLHKKQRMVLFVFCGLLRAKSNRLLNHWAQVELRGFLYLGFQQPARKSLSGSFSFILDTCWKHQHALQNRLLTSFNEKLRGKICNTGCLDNYNKLFRLKTRIEGQNAITHI